MRWRGVSHVEFAVLDYDDSIAFYDALFGWLGYDSFSSLNMEYQSIYYFTRYINPHSYIGIQPARTGGRLTHSDQAVGVNHIALWARSRKEVDRFHREFLVRRDVPVTDEPKDYPAVLARLLRRLLRRPDQRDPLGAGVGAESSQPPPSLGRSIAHFAFSPRVGQTWPIRCLASPCRRGEPCLRPRVKSTGAGCQHLVDLVLPQQKSSFVQLLASHPAGHLGIALAGVARAAAGYDVGDHVAPSARDRQHAILLQGSLGCAAVGASAPRSLQRGPLHVGQVVHFRGDAPSTTARISHCARGPASRHGQKLRPDVVAFGDVTGVSAQSGRNHPRIGSGPRCFAEAGTSLRCNRKLGTHRVSIRLRITAAQFGLVRIEIQAGFHLDVGRVMQMARHRT